MVRMDEGMPFLLQYENVAWYENGKVRILDRMRSAGGGLVWSRVPSAADIHSYRADYACRVYSAHARPLREIPPAERYHCRGDLKGRTYDRKAMMVASKALGHSRLSVIASHYLWRLEPDDD